MSSIPVIIACTAVWYWTSSISAVASQQMVEICTATGTKLCSPFAIMAVLTCLQLIVGLAVCSPLLVLLIGTNKIRDTISSVTRKDLILGGCHFTGCALTNTGYAFGSAGLVQSIKMLEPIETLLIMAFVNVYIFNKPVGITTRTVLAVILIVSGISLLLAKSNAFQPTATAIAAALGSGIIMSTRNVLKKTLLETAPPQAQPLKTEQPLLTKSWKDKCAKGLHDFASITFASCVFALSAMIPILIAAAVGNRCTGWTAFATNVGAKATLFHSFYNIASITVLSLVSAETHSLLNAGKRISNVVVAAIVFAVPLGDQGILGLGIAAIGALLYSKTSAKLLAGSAIACLMILQLLTTLNPANPAYGQVAPLDWSEHPRPEFGTNSTNTTDQSLQSANLVSLLTEDESQMVPLQFGTNSTNTTDKSIQPRTEDKEDETNLHVANSTSSTNRQSIQRAPVVRPLTKEEPKPHAALAQLAADIPREPHLTPGCSVKFQSSDMAVCYFLPYGANFGDELGPAAVKRILEGIFECNSDDVKIINLNGEKRDGKTCLFTLGSIFHMVRQDDHVWGTGINPKWQRRLPKSLTLHSVRGPETGKKMEEKYGQSVTKKRGDPGFLIPFLYPDYYHMPTRNVGEAPNYNKHKFCFVPHAQDLNLNEIVHPPPDLEIISVKQHWQPMLEKIRMCDFVVSTSLHGIVVADAMGIPTKWFQFPGGKTQKTEGNFKYRDYLWSVGRTSVEEPIRMFDMSDFRNASTYIEPLPLTTRKKLMTDFMSSFPLHLFRKTFLPSKPTKIDSNCEVSFRNPHMAICVDGDTKDFSAAMNVQVVQRLLENRFGCSSGKLRILNAAMRDAETICFSPQAHDYAKPGDNVWGSNLSRAKEVLLENITLYPTGGPDDEGVDPGFLFPFLYREHLLIEKEASNLTRFCFMPDVNDKERQISEELPSTVHLVPRTLSPAEAMVFLQKECDHVASSSFNGLLLAHSLGKKSKWIARDEDKEDFKQFQDLSDTQNYTEPLSLDDRERLADAGAKSFPFELFETGQNRTLVIVIGSLRGGELAWHSMYRHLLDLNSADLALVIGETPIPQRNSSLYDRAKYLYEFPEFDDWADSIDEINGTEWRGRILDTVQKKFGLFGAVKGHKGSGAVIFMARWYVAKAFEKYGWKNQYNRFVVTRSDHFYNCSHDLSELDSKYLWVPQGESYAGVTDRHLVCNSEDFLKAIDIYPPLVRHPDKYSYAEFNPERLIKQRWKEESLFTRVCYFPRMMFTCAASGDSTRWQKKSSTTAPEGVFLKYPLEYSATKCRCTGRIWFRNSC